MELCQERERERESQRLLLYIEDPCALTGRGDLTSAARDRGIKPRALCDVDLGYLFSTSWMDAYCIQEV